MTDRPPQRYDQAGREIFGVSPAEVAQVILGVDIPSDPPPAVSSGHIFTRQLEVDGLVIDDQRGRILHVEFQTRADRTLGRRMLRYRVGLEEQTGVEDADQHVVLLHPSADFAGIGEHRRRALLLHYQVHRMWEIEPARLLATPSLVALAPLGAAASIKERENLTLLAAQQIASLANPDLARRAAKWLSWLCNLYLDGPRVHELIGSSTMPLDFSHTDLAEEFRAEGHHQGQLEVLAHLVQTKYGSPALVERLRGLDAVHFDEAAEMVLTLDRDSFSYWLARHLAGPVPGGPG